MEPKSTSKFLPVLGCALLLLAGGVAARELGYQGTAVPDRAEREAAVRHEPATMARSENANAGHFENAEVDLAFDYSPDWLVEERGAPLNRPANAPDIPKHLITVSKPSGESVSIAIFPRVGTLEEWILLSHGYALRKGLVDLDGAKHLVSGQDAYLWSTPPGGHDTPGYLLVFQGEEHVYQVGFAVADVNSDGVREILRSLSTGAGGTTDLPPRTIHSPLKHLQSAATSCTNCGDTDQYSNPYSCCPTFGNCTWKSEQMRSGSNNFTFGTDRPRDAYRWMTLARKHTSYAQGGTMPTIGAVLVAIDDYGGFGHVGTVSLLSKNGER